MIIPENCDHEEWKWIPEDGVRQCVDCGAKQNKVTGEIYT